MAILLVVVMIVVLIVGIYKYLNRDSINHSPARMHYTVTVYDGTKLIKTYKRIDGWYNGTENTALYIGDDVIHVPNKYIIEKYRTK